MLFFCRLWIFFLKKKKLTFSKKKKSFRNTIRVSNSLDPDQTWRFVGPDVGPNFLQRLSADDKSRHKRVKSWDAHPLRREAVVHGQSYLPWLSFHSPYCHSLPQILPSLDRVMSLIGIALDKILFSTKSTEFVLFLLVLINPCPAE